MAKMTPDSHADVIVIGAGVSGLLVARTVQANGARVWKARRFQAWPRVPRWLNC